MHLALAIVLLLVAIGLVALGSRLRQLGPPHGIYYYLNPLDSRLWVAAALGGALTALAL